MKTSSAPAPDVDRPVVIFTNAWMMGGMEQNVLDLGGKLVERGYRVAAVCFATDSISPLRDSLTAAGVVVHVLAGANGLRGRVKRFRQVLTILSEYRGCVLQLTEGWPAGDGLIIAAALLARVSAIVRTEQQGPVLPVTRYQRWLTQLKDRFLAGIVCVSEQNRQEYRAYVGRDMARMSVIPNAIDVDRFLTCESSGVRDELGFPGETLLIGLVARLAEERKGATYFVDMAARVAGEEPRARFVIVGDGPLRPDLEAQAARLGIERLMVFTGTRQDVPRLLKGMDIFVQPSLAEGASYALLEAMLAGPAVVATPVGSAPDLIQDGDTGLLVPLRNAEALAQAVLRLARDDGFRRRLAQAAQARILSDGSIDMMVERYLDVWRAAVRSTPAAPMTPQPILNNRAR